MNNFDNVWNKIVINEGNIFHTIRGKKFKYRIFGNILIPNRTVRNIHKNNFEKAFNELPLEGPGRISNLVQGSSYVWAILNDNRIIK